MYINFIEKMSSEGKYIMCVLECTRISECQCKFMFFCRIERETEGKSQRERERKRERAKQTYF